MRPGSGIVIAALFSLGCSMTLTADKKGKCETDFYTYMLVGNLVKLGK